MRPDHVAYRREIGRRLYALLLARGPLRRSEIAEELGCSPEHVSIYAQYTRELGPQTITGTVELHRDRHRYALRHHATLAED